MKRNLLRLFILSVMSIFTLGASATPDKDYLCFTANTAGSKVELNKIGSPAEVTIEYSTDGTDWTSVDFSSETTTGEITLNNVGDKVYFRNAKTAKDVKGFSRSGFNKYQFAMTGSIAASGNVMSLIDKDCTTKTTTIPCEYCFTCLFRDCSSLTSAPELPATTLTTDCYFNMFYGCKSLVSAPELPATTLANNCYDYMFYGCTSLTSAPELPATTLATECYSCMFRGCTSLTSAPELPATTLATKCYYDMFYGCTSLTSAPKLPATTLADDCYSNMFYNCSSLTSAPELPATTLANRCYYSMFYKCSSLTSAPKLPATKLAEYCYSGMFYNCSSLTSAPELPATTLATNCYYSMFYGCSALASAPELPATTLADNCYYSMFYGCSALASAPELPATTLADNCYYYMFYNCSSLTSAPELPATTLATKCYNTMFAGCTSLNDIKVGFTDWGSTNTTSWVNNVASSGTFACPSALDTSNPDSGKIPSGWTTVTNNYDLTITAAGWASMCVNLPLQVPTGVEVYYASAVSGSQITLTQIEAGTKIAAKTAVLVKGAKGTVSFPIMGEAGTSYTNLFAGTSVDKPFNAEKDGAVYVLSGVGTTGNPQFKNYTGTTLGAHKIWLPKSAVGGSTGAINFVFDDATAINGMDAATPKSSVRYNLNGQAVGADYKGIVIVNGKKYINK